MWKGLTTRGPDSGGNTAALRVVYDDGECGSVPQVAQTEGFTPPAMESYLEACDTKCLKATTEGFTPPAKDTTLTPQEQEN